jgi:hypothetical protein
MRGTTAQATLFKELKLRPTARTYDKEEEDEY